MIQSLSSVITDDFIIYTCFRQNTSPTLNFFAFSVLTGLTRHLSLYIGQDPGSAENDFVGLIIVFVCIRILYFSANHFGELLKLAGITVKLSSE